MVNSSTICFLVRSNWTGRLSCRSEVGWRTGSRKSIPCDDLWYRRRITSFHSRIVECNAMQWNNVEEKRKIIEDPATGTQTITHYYIFVIIQLYEFIKTTVQYYIICCPFEGKTTKVYFYSNQFIFCILILNVVLYYSAFFLTWIDNIFISILFEMNLFFLFELMIVHEYINWNKIDILISS